MLNHDTFLAAICANPDDDAPRLVYADWLEEHGESERAEFIRVQIELAHAPPNAPGRERLLSRQKRLTRAHGKQWAAAIRHHVDAFHFARGFVMSVTMPAARFIAEGESLFGLAPIREAILTHPVGFAEPLAGCAHLGRLTSIGFHSVYATVEAIATTFRSDPFMSTSESLSQPDDRIGDAGLAEILGSPHLTNLVWLYLSGSRISAEGVQTLAHSAVANQLRLLNLSRNAIGDEGLAALLDGNRFLSLESLDVSSAGIGMTLNELLALFLRTMRGRRAESRASRAVRMLADPRVFPSLRHLNLRGNRVLEADRRALKARFGAGVQL